MNSNAYEFYFSEESHFAFGTFHFKQSFDCNFFAVWTWKHSFVHFTETTLAENTLLTEIVGRNLELSPRETLYLPKL
jgi:hypothetical protein